MDKIVTFEEEKRKEFLYVLFNAVFVTTCVVFILNFFFGFICSNIYAGDSLFKDSVDNILRSFFSAVAISAAFVFYGVHSDVSLKSVFTPKKTSVLWFVAGAVTAAGISFFFALISEKAVGLLGNFGYIMNEYTPYILENPAENIANMIVVCLFSAFSSELVFRGILTERFRRANTGVALILPAMIAASMTGSLAKMPYVFFLSIFLSWIYMKSSSVYATLFCAFITDVSLYLFHIYRSALAPYEPLFVFGGLVAAAAFGALLIIKFGIRTVYPAPRDDDDEYLRISAKESVLGILKAFSFWIFVLAVIFTVLFFYLSNPTVEMP